LLTFAQSKPAPHAAPFHGRVLARIEAMTMALEDRRAIPEKKA
jgi:hypothetical protein